MHFLSWVNNLGMRTSRGVIISAWWAEVNVTSYSSTSKVQLWSLRKKISEHKNYQAHSYQHSWNGKGRRSENSSSGFKDRLFTLYIHVLPNVDTQSEQTLFQSTARVSRTAYYKVKNNKPFTNFESLIDLHEGNSIDMGRVLHSTTVAVDTIGRVSSQMKKNSIKIIERRSKINVLADECTLVGDKSTLIIFVKASVEEEAAPVTFPHWIWLNWRPCVLLILKTQFGTVS